MRKRTWFAAALAAEGAAAHAASAGLIHPSLALTEPITAAGVGRSGMAEGVLTGPTSQRSDERGSEFILSVDVTGILSMDLRGSPNNVVRLITSISNDDYILGVGWDVVIQTVAPKSWRSEMGFAITTQNNVLGGVTVRPAVGSNSPGGPTHYFSPPIRFSDVNLPSMWLFPVGTIRLEFFDSFDDAPGEPDGLWVSGTINLLMLPYIPAPYATTLVVLVVASGSRRARR